MSPSAYRPGDFIEDVESLFDMSRPDTLLGVHEHVERLAASGSVSEWLNEHLKLLSQQPAADGDWASKEVVLHRGHGWNVSVALLDVPRRYIHALATIGVCVPLGGAPLTVERYCLPEVFRNDVFDPAVRVTPLDHVTVAKNEALQLDTRRMAYYFQVPQPVAMLRIESAPVRPLEWLFSRQTLQAWQANDSTLAYTQLRVAAYVLGKVAHQSSIAPLRKLAEHSHHAVRWAAIQNLGRLNRSEALIKIREAVNDPHPHVRRAAQKTLDIFEGKGRA